MLTFKIPESTDPARNSAKKAKILAYSSAVLMLALANQPSLAQNPPEVQSASEIKISEKAEAPAQNLENASCDLFSQLIKILSDNASEPPQPYVIVERCLEAAKEYLSSNNLDGDFLKAPENKDLQIHEAISEVCRLYKEALKKYDKLAFDSEFSAAVARAVMESADDDYTVFISSGEFSDLDSYLSGDYSGSLGITLRPFRDSQGNSHFEIVQLLKGAPAQKAGLHIGDELLEIDGHPLTKAVPSECTSLLRGADGSQIDLVYASKTALAAKYNNPRKLRLTRTKVHYPAAEAEVIEADGVKLGLLTLDTFTLSSNLETERALRELEKEGCQGYILDLRSNPGGYTNAARDICSKFLPKPSLLASLRDRNGKIEQKIYSYQNMHEIKPLAVLIDGKTASAAEITAGALKAHKAAVLIGTQSFGKNSSQRIYNFDFPPGKTSACKVTYSHYITPDNLDLGKTGLTPDYTEEMPSRMRHKRSKDTQLKKAAEILKNLINKQG